LEGRWCITQTKWHPTVRVRTVGTGEGGHLLVLRVDWYLEEARVTIQVTKVRVVRKPFQELVNKWQRKVILACGSIQFPVIDAHSIAACHTSLDQLVFLISHHSCTSFLWHHMDWAHPPAVRDRIDDASIQKLENLFLDNFLQVRVEPSLVFN
jgi:hypothetical protein